MKAPKGTPPKGMPPKGMTPMHPEIHKAMHPKKHK